MALPTDTISASHAFVSAVADGGDTSLVQPSNWNADHPVTGFGVISSNCTLTVGATGCDYTSVVTAYNALKAYWIAPPAVVTISVSDGTYSEPPLRLDHPCGQSIRITGPTPLARWLSSIVSSSGSAGNWSYVLQLTDNSGIAAGDFVVTNPISLPAGGVNPLRITGLSKVTNVEASNRITVNTRHRNTDVASGAVSGSLSIIKAVLQPNDLYDYAVVVPKQCNGGTLSNFVIDAAAVDDPILSALFLDAGSALMIDAANGAGFGVWMPGDHNCAIENYSGRLIANWIGVAGPYDASNNRYGVSVYGESTTEFVGGSVSGSYYGLTAFELAVVNAALATATGNVYGVKAFGNGRIWLGAAAHVTGNVTGQTAVENADCKVSVLG